MAEKKTEHHIRVDPTWDGVVLIRFERRTIDEHGNVTRQYHRTSIEPGTPLDAQMEPVNAHLVQLGFEVPDAATMGNMRKVVEAVHTPAVIAKFKAEREKQERDRRGGKP